MDKRWDQKNQKKTDNRYNPEKLMNGVPNWLLPHGLSIW